MPSRTRRSAELTIGPELQKRLANPPLEAIDRLVNILAAQAVSEYLEPAQDQPPRSPKAGVGHEVE